MLKKISDINFECIPLQWDTDYFGISSARVNLNGIVNVKEQDIIIDFCKHYDFVTIFNQDNLKENNLWIGNRTSAFLADVNVQFVKILTDVSIPHDEKTYVLSNLPRNTRILEIAKMAFNFSRFFNDPKLPGRKSKNIYYHWTDCAFEKDDKHFVIAERKGKIAGFILFSYHEDQSTIELIAVDNEFQGKGVGKSMLVAMESSVLELGIRKIKVGTQVNNIKAAKFYTSMGFEYLSCGSTYHLWI